MSMKVLGIIPARGGSKEIPGKNIRPLGGFPLIAYSIAAGSASARIDRLIVSTDDERIAAIARKWGAEVPFLRPAELARDETIDLPVFEHALEWLWEHDHYRPDVVVQLRPTSPLRPRGCIDAAMDLLLDSDSADSVRGVTAAAQTPYRMWRTEAGRILPLLQTDLHEPYDMPRHALPQVYWQTGHVEAVRIDTILGKHSMTGEQVLPFIIDGRFAVDLDAPAQWALLEQLLHDRSLERIDPASLLPSGLSDIRLLVSDFDGVLTDNSVCVHQDGSESVVCSRADGYGVAQMRANGVPVVVLSGETNPVVAARCRKLDIPFRQGVSEKRGAIRALATDHGCELSAVAYIGNDVNDIPAMEEVGLSIAVADAHQSVLVRADMVLSSRGGKGALREACERILEEKGEPSHA